MTSTNLTQREAVARADLISSVHYAVDLDLRQGADLSVSQFPSRTTVNFRSGAGSTFIDFRAREVRQVVLDGQDITADAVGSDPSSYDATRGIVLNNLSEGEHTLSVDALGDYSTTGEGLHRFRDPADNRVYMYSQFETADAKRVFACFDQPDIKATYSMQVRTPEDWSLVTNNVVSTRPADEEPGSSVIHTSTVDYWLSTYLIAFCVGPWHEVRDEWRGIITAHPETRDAALEDARTRGKVHNGGEQTVPLGLYCRQSLAEYLDAAELFTITKQGFDYYSEHFGIGYPFYKYDQVFCPEYNMGAMENAGVVTIRDEYVFRSAASHYEYERRADTILHELAHMWFGDLVTMQWWNDLWLNESFATWSAAMSQAHATKFDTAWVTFGNKEKAWAYAQDQLSTTHPVFTDASDIVTVDANFDGITYAKGASVLKQLATYVGLDAFFAGVRTHFAAHAWSNATFDDLLSALEESSGRDLSDWADQWLKTTGINTLRAEFSVTDGAYSEFSVHQTGAQPGKNETRTHHIAIGVYKKNAEGTLEQTHRVEADINGDTTEIPELTGVAAGDVVLVNDDDLTYAFMELDANSLHHATENIANIADPMARSLMWSSAWQMTHAAQMRARDFVELVARGAVAETEMAVLEQVLGQARVAVDSYADPAWAPKGWAVLRETFLRGMKETTGQAQLAFMRAFAGCVHSAESGRIIRELLGSETAAEEYAPGLVIDQDLRWQLLIALAVSTRTTGDDSQEIEELIAKEEAADGSSAGAMLAIQARSAVPEWEVKEFVWNEITQKGPELSNLVLRNRMAGLTRVGQSDLLQRLSQRYIDVAPSLWNSLSPEMALRTLEGIYPLWDESEETDQRIEALIAADSTPAGLRRTLKEGRDRVARSRQARSFDATGVTA